MKTNQSRISRIPGNMAGGRCLRTPRSWIAGGLAAVLVYAGSVLFENQGWAQRADQTPQYSDIRHSGHHGGDFLFVRRR